MKAYYHPKNKDQEKSLAANRGELCRWKSASQKPRKNYDASGMNDHANRDDHEGVQEFSQHKLFH
jgi:hypothetical protein